MQKSIVTKRLTGSAARLFHGALVLACGCLLNQIALHAAPVTVDPAPALVNYWSGGEWDVDGDFGGWATAQSTNAVVTNGVLTAAASGADSHIVRLNFAGGADLDLGFNDYLDLRLQLPADYNGDVQIYYGDTFYPGINGTRVVIIPAAQIPKDGAFHVYRIDLGLAVYWRGTLRDLRIDPLDATGAGKTFAIDYIRVGDLAGDVYLPRYTTANPAAGQLHELGRPVIEMVSKHFRFQWDTNVATQNGWTANTPRGTLRNLEETWQVYVKHLGYKEPAESWTVANRNGNKYKVNMSTWHSGYWAGGDSGNFGRLNITPDGLRVDPPSWVIPHEVMHVFQMHQRDNGSTVDGTWWEGHANYGRELWISYYRNLFPNDSGIDAGYIHSAHMNVAHGRDYYLSWPFFVYLDENPDNLPDLGAGIVANMWKSNAPGVYPYVTIENVTPVTSIKDIIGYFARRELTFDYQNQTAMLNALNAQNPTVWRRFQLAELVRRSDDPNWWRVPMEMAPMQGAYATHEFLPQGSGAGRVVTVNFRGLPDAARGADWRAAFIAISDTGLERYTPLWNAGSNSITLAANENRLYLAVAGTPDQMPYPGHDDLQYPYRSHPSKQRFHYELQVFGATPRESTNSAAGLIPHANGGGWKSTTAIVDDTVFVGPNARVLGTAQVRNLARIEDFAVVQNNAQVLNNAIVSGHALVMNNAIVRQNAKVRDWAIVSGSAVIADFGKALEHAQVQGGVVTNYGVAKGSAILWNGGFVGGHGVIEGDFMAARAVTNGVAYGHLPFSGVPDSWVRLTPDRLYAAYDFSIGEKNDSMIRDAFAVTDGYLIGNPAWRTNDAGRSGVLAFNGSNQYVALDKSLCDFKEWSLALWLKWNGGASNQPAIFLGSAPNRGLFVTPDNGVGQIKFAIRINAAEQTLVANRGPVGEWMHVAVTLSNSVGRIFTNGVLAAQGNITFTPDQLFSGNTNGAPQHHYLARGADPAGPFFNGSLDAVRIYSKALTPVEIAALATPILPNAGTLYVDLRAAHPSANTATWTNLGTLGNFTRVGLPLLVNNVAGTGIPGVSFSGSGQAFAGPNSPADIDGSGDRSIEVWAFNPALAAEETMVSWAHRGFDGRNMAFNFGNNGTWGAVTHWGGAHDVGWGTPPTANAWHHLIYTYTNNITKLYVNGVLRNSRTLGSSLNTFANEPINVACQRDTANGTRSFYFSGYLNTVRIHGGVLTEEQVAANYAAGPSQNQPPVLAPIADQVVGAGVTLTLTNVATDPDSWQALSFGLASAPGGATMASGTGVFTWRPVVAQANTTNTVTVTVADNGSPSLTNSMSFQVIIPPVAAPQLSSTHFTNGQFTLQVTGDIGPDYSIDTSTNLLHWNTIFTTNSPTLPFTWSDSEYGQSAQRFYRVLLGP
jgi:hypothetical protein